MALFHILCIQYCFITYNAAKAKKKTKDLPLCVAPNVLVFAAEVSHISNNLGQANE